MIKDFLYIGLGGTLGTLARYACSRWLFQILGDGFPVGTFFVNILGCFLLGFLALYENASFSLSAHARLLLTVGFCGAFTTFSTFMLETNHLLGEGFFKALFYVLASVALGFIAFKLGIVVAERMA